MILLSSLFLWSLHTHQNMLEMVSLYPSTKLYYYILFNIWKTCTYVSTTLRTQIGWQAESHSYIPSIVNSLTDSHLILMMCVWKLLPGWMSMFFNINYLSFLPHKTNHKSLYVVLGLHNVLDCGKNIGDCDHTCIIHLEVGKQVMNHSLVRKQDQATYEHALSNTRWTRKWQNCESI